MSNRNCNPSSIVDCEGEDGTKCFRIQSLPIRITEPGTYNLDRDLFHDSNKIPAITLGSKCDALSGVTINLNNYSINIGLEGTLLKSTNVSDVVIQNGSLQSGVSSAVQNIGLNIRKADNWTFNNITTNNIRFAWLFRKASNINVTNCRFNNNILAMNFETVNALKITGCNFNTMVSQAIQWTKNSYNVTVEGCTFTNSYDEIINPLEFNYNAINFDWCKGTIIRDCQFHHISRCIQVGVVSSNFPLMILLFKTVLLVIL